ncbi:MAG: PepSY-like domain-containing protein [Planctomycetes bacterium]|nr:PepSY-like domain-containing protein [Planctomycetota bacterium]
MRQRGLWVVVMLAAAVLASVGLTVLADDEEQVSLEQLPPAVRATIEKHAAGATLKEIEKETRNGVVTYEAEIVRDGVTYELKVAADGKFLAMEAEGQEVEDGEKKIALEEAPPAVQAAIRKVVGEHPIKEVLCETHGGIMAYEAEYEVDGLEHSVTCAASGEVTELELGIPIGSLPPAVRSAVDARFPGATLKEVNRVQVFFYEVEGMKDGKTFEVNVCATGRMPGGDKGTGAKDDQDDEGRQKEEEKED